MKATTLQETASAAKEAQETPSAAPEESASHVYWKSFSGFNYMEMVRTRESTGNRAYGQQERVLTTLVESERERLGREVRVLEFGCGFGRHAAYLSPLPGVRYHGYDFSEPMVEPLRQAAPPSLLPLEERLFVGPEVGPAVGSQRFDLVFTVSVLIHNPPERLPGLLQQLGAVLSPEGLVCLVENQAVPFTVYDNEWHRGCWLHPYAELLPEGWDLHHGSTFIDTHDVYVLKRNGGSTRRYFSLHSPPQPRDEGQPLTLEQLQGRGLPKLRAWAWSVEQVLRQPSTSQGARVSELEERLSIELERSRRRQRLHSLADELARLRASAAALPPSSSLSPPPPARHAPEAILIDNPHDTAWANHEPQLARLLHVFHQEWYGIRAASGYAPGHKLALTADRPLTAEELRHAIEECAKLQARTVIFQGFSNNAQELLLLLRSTFGSSLRLCCVWHGSTSQFHFAAERETFTRLLELRAQGVLDGLACVKPEMCLLSPAIFQGTIFNFAPRVSESERRRSPGARSRAAFIPTPNNWWKNFYSNLYAAASSPALDTVYVTSPFESSPQLPLRSRLISVGSQHRSELFRLINQVDVLLNVTLAECQPMTALEGVAFGVPCLTGPLSLGALDEHPYQKLVQVAGTASLKQIRAALDRLLELQERSPSELSQMIEDYVRALHAQAVQSYLEFTQP